MTSGWSMRAATSAAAGRRGAVTEPWRSRSGRPGVSRLTVYLGLRKLASPVSAPERVRQPGGGCKTRSERDPGEYPTKVKVSNEELASVRLTPHEFHGELNCTLTPHLHSPI